MTFDTTNCQYVIRFILEKKCRQPFQPPKNLKLSVNYECGITNLKEMPTDQTWNYGVAVAEFRNKNENRNSIKLRSGARLPIEIIEKMNLNLVHAEVTEEDAAPTNPYHANITNWPVELIDQEEISRKLLMAAENFDYKPKTRLNE